MDDFREEESLLNLLIDGIRLLGQLNPHTGFRGVLLL